MQIFQKEYAVVVQPLKNGKYKYIKRYVDPLLTTANHTVTKQVTVTLEKNTKKAKQIAATILQNKIDNKLTELGMKQITIKDLKDKYFKKIEQSKRFENYQTMYVYQSHINIFMKDIDPDIVVEHLGTPYFRKYFDKMMQSKSWSYCNVRRAALWNMFDFGVNYGYLNVNPIQNFKLKKPKNSEDDKDIEDKYFKDEEYHAFIKSLKDRDLTYYSDFFEFLYYTGMRVGECAALHPDDVFQKANGNYYVRINGTLSKKHDGKRGNAKKKVGAKHDSNRVIYLPPEAVKIYKRHNKGHKFLFVKRTTRNPMDTSSVNKEMKKTAKRAGIKKDITSHFFRHTHVSKLAELGVEWEVVRRRVGHKDSKTTKEIYFHVTEKMQSTLEAKINSLGSKEEKINWNKLNE